MSSIDPILRRLRELSRSIDQTVFAPGRIKLVTLILVIFLLRGCWMFATRDSRAPLGSPGNPASAPQAPLQLELISAQRTSSSGCRLDLRIRIDPQRRGNLSLLLFKSIATTPASKIELCEASVFRLGAQRVGLAQIELTKVPEKADHFELIGVAQLSENDSKTELIEQRLKIQLSAPQTEKPASPSGELDGPPR